MCCIALSRQSVFVLSLDSVSCQSYIILHKVEYLLGPFYLRSKSFWLIPPSPPDSSVTMAALPGGVSELASGFYLEARDGYGGAVVNHCRGSDDFGGAGDLYCGRRRDDYSGGGRDDYSSRGRDDYSDGGRVDYGGGERDDYGSGGRDDYGGGGRDDTYRKERNADSHEVERGSSVAVTRGGFLFRRQLDPEESDVKKELAKTCKEKKELEHELVLQKKKHLETVQKINLAAGDVEIEKRKRQASEVSFKRSETNCAELDKEKKKLQNELASQKKKNAEKIQRIKLAEVDVEIEIRKRKASDDDAEVERKKRIKLEIDLEEEIKKRRRAEDEFKKKRIALAAEKKKNHQLEEGRKMLEEELENFRRVQHPRSLEIKRQRGADFVGSSKATEKGSATWAVESGARVGGRSTDIVVAGGLCAADREGVRGSECSYLGVCSLSQQAEPAASHPMAKHVPSALVHLQEKHVAWFQHWVGLLDREAEQDGRCGQQLRDLWLGHPEEREERGQAASGLALYSVGEEGHCFTREGGRQARAVLAAGEVVTVSSDTELALTQGVVRSEDGSRLVVRLDRDLSGHKGVFCVDRFVYAGGQAGCYSGLARLMADSPAAGRLRAAVIDLELPESAAGLGKEAAEHGGQVMQQLNKVQQKAIFRTLMCRHYSLIRGMQGSGMTMTISSLVRLMVLLGQSVLVVAFTNRAVDTILGKLVAQGQEVLRLGRKETVREELRSSTAEEVTRSCTNPEELRLRLASYQVVGATCLGTEHAATAGRNFDWCVLDEASQAVLPSTLAPLLLATRFVLVGDPAQLPPTVRSQEARKGGLGKSLFSVLDSAHPSNTQDLTLQYRMNQGVTALANHLTYSGRLESGSEEVAARSLNLSRVGEGWVAACLAPQPAVVWADTCEGRGQEREGGISKRGEGELLLERGGGVVGRSPKVNVLDTEKVEDRSSTGGPTPVLKLHRKPKAKTAKIKVLMPSGPFALDVVKLRADYRESPQHIDTITAFPRLQEEVFITTAEDKIPGCKNGKFLNLLYHTNDAVATLEAFRLTKQGYREKYGEEWVPLEVMPAMGPSGLRGRNLDTVEGASKSVRSEAWLNGLTWIYNTLVDFVLEKEEFRCFDWFTATAEDYDIVIGYFWLWVGPKEGGGSLGGTRFTTDSLKILKTKLVNLLLYVVKRPDIDVNSSAMRFSKSMYETKRNKTAAEPMVGNAGDRKRVAVGEEDREKLDMWLTKSPDQVD